MPVTAASGSATLAAHSLSKRFGERWALREVSFEVGSGELVAIIGPNGAGKTTLLSILAGIEVPTSGEIATPAGKVGWVPQQPAVYSKLSVAENLRLFARLEGLADPEEAVERMLELVGLRERAQEPVGRLSGGTRQRVNVAVGLLCQPAALLLDEPSAALDPRQRERLWSFVARLGQGGTTVVYSTHDILEAERYADRVLVLAEGELVFAGTPGELERAVDGHVRDLEAAFLRFLDERGR